MQLEPIPDNSGADKMSRQSSVGGDKMSRQASVGGMSRQTSVKNGGALSKASSKGNVHGVPPVNLPPQSTGSADNSGSGVAYTGILSHHKRDETTYVRPISGNGGKGDAFVSFAATSLFFKVVFTMGPPD